MTDTGTEGPHQGEALLTAGTDPEAATAAMVLVHGRGASARSILGTGEQLHREGLALFAPQAAGNTWYPDSFLAPVERNEPGRTSGLRAVGDAIAAATDAGIPPANVIVLGFSQGACLATEYAARNPRRFGGVVAFSGGVIGEEIDTGEYEGSLAGTPAFVGCSDVDPHIPVERVHVTAEVLERLGADVEKRIYEGMGHGVNGDEIEYVSGMVADLLD
ncbi:MAG: dienelactone hydrolase family protein [Haloarculaceae archaeon]